MSDFRITGGPHVCPQCVAEALEEKAKAACKRQLGENLKGDPDWKVAQRTGYLMGYREAYRELRGRHAK
jgi:hypothetical protein